MLLGIRILSSGEIHVRASRIDGRVKNRPRRTQQQ